MIPLLLACVTNAHHVDSYRQAVLAMPPAVPVMPGRSDPNTGTPLAVELRVGLPGQLPGGSGQGQVDNLVGGALSWRQAWVPAFETEVGVALHTQAWQSGNARVADLAPNELVPRHHTAFKTSLGGRLRAELAGEFGMVAHPSTTYAHRSSTGYDEATDSWAPSESELTYKRTSFLPEVSASLGGAAQSERLRLAAGLSWTRRPTFWSSYVEEHDCPDLDLHWGGDPCEGIPERHPLQGYQDLLVPSVEVGLRSDKVDLSLVGWTRAWGSAGLRAPTPHGLRLVVKPR